MRIPIKFVLSLATLLFGMLVLVPSSGWATTVKDCPSEPATNVPITSGVTYSGTNCATYTTGDIDSFQFNANSGDTWTVVLGLASLNWNQNTCLTIYAPGSTTPIYPETCSGYGNGYGSTSVATTQLLSATGLYTIIVQGSADATISYGLSLERLNPTPPDGVPLTLSKSVSAEVAAPSAQNAYTLYGNASSTYQITASLPSPAWNDNVCFQVYSAGTTVLGPACTSYGNGYGATSVSENLTPTTNGTYVLVLSSEGNSTTVSYDLEASCLLGNCGPPPPSCTLKDALTYSSSTDTLTMTFTVQNSYPVTWNAWLTYQKTLISIPGFPISQPITNSPLTIPKTYTGLGAEGIVGVLSTFTTSTGGITCSSWQLVNTGKP